MNILVTGGAGFIGSNFVLRHRELFPKDNIVVLDKLTYAGDKSRLDSVIDSIKFIRGDICSADDVMPIVRDFYIDTIVNFAAETHVDNSIKNREPFIKTNICGVDNLIEVCKVFPKILLQHVSTDEVYGELFDGMALPDSPLRPGNPYSATKAAGDLMLLAAARTYGIRVRITRCTNNYGPHQASEKLIPTVIDRAMKAQPIPIYGNGMQKRDWLYVDDHVDAIRTVMQYGEDGKIYLVSAYNEKTNMDIAEEIIVLADSDSVIRSVEDRVGHDFRYALDSSELRSMGWKPKVSFDEGIRKTIDYYFKRQGYPQRSA